MYRARVIPVLLLKGRGLVKTVNFRGEKYVGDPLNAVKIFNDKGVDELFFVDIAASKTGGGINFDILSKIAAQSFMPLGYGGGVRSVDDARRIFELGFEKVSVNSEALKRMRFLSELAARFGSQSIVSSIDVRKVAGGYGVFDHVSGKVVGIDPVAFAKKAAECGAGEIVLNSVDLDGMMKGYDLELIRRVSSAVDVPVIALGGAGSPADFEAALGAGASAVAAGSMFVFYGPHRAVLINYPDFGR